MRESKRQKNAHLCYFFILFPRQTFLFPSLAGSFSPRYKTEARPSLQKIERIFTYSFLSFPFGRFLSVVLHFPPYDRKYGEGRVVAEAALTCHHPAVREIRIRRFLCFASLMMWRNRGKLFPHPSFVKVRTAEAAGPIVDKSPILERRRREKYKSWSSTQRAC